ncbi:MAG TPA: hypothetical protein VE650_18830 [Acetobacteraceae bacterium]|nr:hypothetical protein [Acetobacteraceae bacterium]
MPFPRRLALVLPLLLASCGDDEPLRRDFPPLRYEYLTKLRLNVASVELAAPPPPGPLDQINPAPPAQALLRMAEDRLAAGGSLGRAVFVIDEARTVQIPGGLEGVLAVHLDVLTSEGTRAGFAEARVSRRVQGIGRDLVGALYDITRQMMDDMNVEFEFQVRRSLRDWLQEPELAPPPPPVERQELAPPSP